MSEGKISTVNGEQKTARFSTLLVIALVVYTGFGFVTAKLFKSEAYPFIMGPEFGGDGGASDGVVTSKRLLVTAESGGREFQLTRSQLFQSVFTSAHGRISAKCFPTPEVTGPDVPPVVVDDPEVIAWLDGRAQIARGAADAKVLRAAWVEESRDMTDLASIKDRKTLVEFEVKRATP